MRIVMFLLAFAPLATLSAAEPAWRLVPSKEKIDCFFGDQLVTSYIVDEKMAKPHFWPLHTPDGTLVTATAPADHKHHRSVWFCHGDVIPEGLEMKTRSSDKRVKGVDCWSEHTGHGTIVCDEVRKPEVISSTEVRLPTTNHWLTPDGVKFLTESRTLSLQKQPNGYLIIFDIDLFAEDYPITFGDTKEGALGTRVHAQIGTPKGGNGKLTNSAGKVDEKNIWGQPFDWQDYSGKVDDKPVGLTVMDHPSNPSKAVSHGRAYGLLAGNPFGRKAFPSTKDKPELIKLAKGEHLKLKYAVYAHTGDAKTGDVAGVYKRFAATK